MFWDNLTKFLSFTGVKDASVWQDVFIGSPITAALFFLFKKIFYIWNTVKPSQLLFKNCLGKGEIIFIFHSQMSGADNDYNFNPDQKYITRYPEPLPSNHANLGIQKKLRIDPVLSEAETGCLTDIYNVLGRTGKVNNINIGDLINDWNIWSQPIFSVGFNPKTLKLIEKCVPIFFELLGGEIKIKDHNIHFGSIMPNDSGVIQKTFIKDASNPIFILAGLGTMGTRAAGYILRQNFIEIGKLYGSGPFCAFLRVRIDEGVTAAFIDKIYPKPNWFRRILYPITYYKFAKKNFFNFNN